MQKNKIKTFALLIIALLFVFCSCKNISEQSVSTPDQQIEQTVLNEEKAPVKTEDTAALPTEITQKAEHSQSTIAEEPETQLTCSLAIRCDDVLKNPESLKEDKKSVIPADGIILFLTDVVFTEGESVFDVVLREVKKAQIHFEFEKTPMYDSAYIRGIGNLYEFDCGDCSGWQYKVNDKKPTYGCSQYILKDKDKIEFFYSCNYFESK